MKIYKTQQDVEKDIKDGVLSIDGDVTFECSISINASIVVAGNIHALNINALNINAWDINALNIHASDINAWNINAGNIHAGNIHAWDINARNIRYYAFCSVYKSIVCLSIKAKRSVHQKPICLEGKLTTIKDDVEKTNDDFEPTERPNEPLFSFNWIDAIIILGFSLFFVGILSKIISVKC